MTWHSLPGTVPHFLLEACAYAIGARLYWRAARLQAFTPSKEQRLSLLAGAILGALLGSKLLHLLEHLPALVQANDILLWLGGKSLLGGLLGGTLAVEMVKRHIGWPRPTGDAWVPALAIGIIIGRLGCQISEKWDFTYGSPTGLPWAWDYGDGIGRHPTAAYEMTLVAILWIGLARWTKAPAGARFAAFLLGYCMIRLVLEFVKPPFGGDNNATLPVALYGTLTAIQWAALAGAAYFSSSLSRRLHPPASVET